MVTSIYNIETWKQMGVVRRFKSQKRRKSSMIGDDEVDELKLSNDEVDKKKHLKKKKRTSIQWWLICHKQKISHQKIYTFWHCVINDEVLSNSSQIVEQIIQGVVLPVIPKLNDSATEKKPGNQARFSPKKDSRKRKMDLTFLLYLLSHQLMDLVIE